LGPSSLLLTPVPIAPASCSLISSLSGQQMSQGQTDSPSMFVSVGLLGSSLGDDQTLVAPWLLAHVVVAWGTFLLVFRV
jgi:hypothetical protein